MKARTIALLWVLACGMAMAQAAPPSQAVAPGSKPAAAKPAQVQPAKPAVPKAGQRESEMRKKLHPSGTAKQETPAQAAQPAAQAKPAASPAQPKPEAKKASKAAAKPAAGSVKKAAIKTAAAGTGPAKRDPFLSPIREASTTGPACTTGKKCLAINTIVLRGIVKSQNGMIAVVESSIRRISYFLRENDPVFNGYVVKITGDTVVFRENIMDRLGKQSTRDVVMKVVAPAV